MSELATTEKWLNFPIPFDLDDRLEHYAKTENTHKYTLILQAIENYLEDLEDTADAEKILSDLERGEVEIISSEEMEKRLAMDN